MMKNQMWKQKLKLIINETTRMGNWCEEELKIKLNKIRIARPCRHTLFE